uniref:Amino acid transporter n=1 Tax=Trichobilharzia regenti TaxID=157069 RepID=A0AA85KB39_TRIRE|nr:unnamed protein product [Trichobilharzia regenti]
MDFSHSSICNFHSYMSRKFRSLKKFIRKNITIICMFMGILLGIALGAILKVFPVPESVLLWIGLPGELFIRSLNFAVIPLLTGNIITMSSKLKPSVQGKMAILALSYCVGLNIVASFLGLGITSLINPGGRFMSNSISSQTSSEDRNKVEISDVFMDFFRNMVPDNFVKMFLYSTATVYKPSGSSNTSTPDSINNITIINYERVVGTTPQTNILGILTTSLVIGLVAGCRGEKVRPLIELAESVSEIMTVITEVIIKLLPVAMISLIGYAIGRMERVEENFIALVLFIASSITFHTIIILLVLPLFIFITVRRNLFRFYCFLSEPVLTAFSSTSSLIALPQLFRVCDRYGIDPDLVRTVAPFLTSFNANGSAAFIASAVCFVTQLARQPLNAGQFIAVGFLSGINVMALPAIPSASIITVILITRAFNLSESAISLLFVVEFIADRLRTVVNVMSHATCVLFIHLKLKQNDATLNLINSSRNQADSLNQNDTSIDNSESNNVISHNIYVS